MHVLLTNTQNLSEITRWVFALFNYYLFILLRLLRFYFESLKEKFPYYSKLDSCRRGHLVICGQASRWSASIIVLLGHFFNRSLSFKKQKTKNVFTVSRVSNCCCRNYRKKIAATVQDELFLIPVNIFSFFDWRIPGVWNYIFPFLVGSLRVEQWVKVLGEDFEHHKAWWWFSRGDLKPRILTGEIFKVSPRAHGRIMLLTLVGFRNLKLKLNTHTCIYNNISRSLSIYLCVCVRVYRETEICIYHIIDR